MRLVSPSFFKEWRPLCASFLPYFSQKTEVYPGVDSPKDGGIPGWCITGVYIRVGMAGCTYGWVWPGVHTGYGRVYLTGGIWPGVPHGWYMAGCTYRVYDRVYIPGYMAGYTLPGIHPTIPPWVYPPSHHPTLGSSAAHGAVQGGGEEALGSGRRISLGREAERLSGPQKC